jgi:hypothetical protein
VVERSANLPDEIKAGVAGVVYQGFIGAAVTYAFLFLHCTVPLTVDPNIESRHVVIMNLHPNAHSAKTNDPVLVQWDDEVVPRRLSFHVRTFRGESILLILFPLPLFSLALLLG